MDEAFDPLWGSTLGQMRLRGIAFEKSNGQGQRDPLSIDMTQYDTANRYQKLIFQYRRLKGIPSPNPKSPAFSDWIRGTTNAPDLDDEEIQKICGRHSDARRMLLDTGMTHGQGSRVNWIVYEIVIMDRSIDLILPNDFGNFKLGLNSLARVV